MAFFGKSKETKAIKYPGIRIAVNGRSAVLMNEGQASIAAGFVSTPENLSLSAYWEKAKTLPSYADLHIPNAAAANSIGGCVGLSLTGMRCSYYCGNQEFGEIQQSLTAAVGKRLPLLIHLTAQSVAKSTHNQQCSHDNYHSLDNTGALQLFAHNAQSAADLSIIGRKIAELSLNPVVIAQDGESTAELIETVDLAERELLKEFLGQPDDLIDAPTPSQRLLYGEKRRRAPLIWDVDNPLMTGASADSNAYMHSTAAQRPYFFDHLAEITQQCMDEWHELTGRQYQRIKLNDTQAAEYLIITQGGAYHAASAVAEHLNEIRNIKISVADMTLFRPFPGDIIGRIVKAKKGVLILERTDQPLAEDLPIIRAVRATIGKCLENGRHPEKPPHADHAAYQQLDDAPVLYSGCYGLGGRELQFTDIIAAIDNMIAGDSQKKFFYLGLSFHRLTPITPKQEVQIQQVEEAYPGLREMTLTLPHTGNWFAADPLSLRFESTADHGVYAAGENMALCLFNALDLPIKSLPLNNPQAQGQTQRYLLAASEQELILNTQTPVTTLLISDANVFNHSDPLPGLVKHGNLILQSRLSSAQEVWRSLPTHIQKFISNKEINCYFINAEQISEDVSDAAAQPNSLAAAVLSGAFLKIAALPETADAEDILKQLISIYQERLTPFNKQSGSTYENAIQRGYAELAAIDHTQMTVGDIEPDNTAQSANIIPLKLQQRPANDHPISDVHRFWNHTGYTYISKNAQKTLVDPFIATGAIPAATGMFRDMTTMRREHPVWIPENCTACGDCYTYCPDSAIPGLINTVGEVFETNIKRIEREGKTVKHLRRAIRMVEKKYHQLATGKTEGDNLKPVFAKAIGETIKEYPDHSQEAVHQEFEWFKDAMGDFKFALTKPYHDAMNKRQANSGGLYSITIDPYACKGCMECVKECEDGALKAEIQTTDSVETLRRDWDYWMDLPTSNDKFSRIDDLDEKIGALHTLMQDKRNYRSFSAGDNAHPGNGEKSSVHLFTATITALMQGRVKKHCRHINQLINDMERHIRLKLAENLDISDADAIEDALEQNKNVDLTLARLSAVLDETKGTFPIDKDWLKWASQIVVKLRHLKWQYEIGDSGEGRAAMGISNSADQTGSWGGHYPYNPYPFPWASHLYQDAPAVALGLFEGHMVKMAEGFKTMRTAELEIAGQYDREFHDAYFKAFNWQQFSDEEYKLCPPVVCIGGANALSDNGFHNLSRAISSGAPLKVLLLNNHELNQSKEISLIAMAHQQCFVLQSAQSHLNHLLEGYIDGLNYPGAAIFNIYAANQKVHGIADDMATRQSKMAVESRAFPLLSFNPDNGSTWKKCLSLQGNPGIEQTWSQFTLEYTDEYGNQEKMQLPFTLADWALSEGRFNAYFSVIPQQQWDEDTCSFHEFVQLSEADREGQIPFVWAINPDNNQLLKMQVAPKIVELATNAQQYWTLLKGLTGDDEKIDPQAIADNAKAEAAQTLVSGLMNLVTDGNAEDLLKAISSAPSSNIAIATPTAAASTAATDAAPAAAPANSSGHDAVWIETPDCTTCDECVDINPNIFQYNDEKKAVVVNPTAGTFADIVKAAEKCTAVIIHPGTPWNPNEANLDKLIKRAEKFQ